MSLLSLTFDQGSLLNKVIILLTDPKLFISSLQCVFWSEVCLGIVAHTGTGYSHHLCCLLDYLGARTGSLVDQALQDLGHLLRQWYDWASGQCCVHSPGEETESAFIARLLPARAWELQYRGIPYRSAQLCSELRWLLYHLLSAAGQGQVRETMLESCRKIKHLDKL